MTALKLYFDECTCEELPKKLKELYSEHYPQFEVRHYREDFEGGLTDSQWIPQLSNDWIVVTTDKGTQPNERLPLICDKNSITHLVITPTLLHLGYEKYKQAILCVWPQITQMPLLPKGTTVLLGLRKYYTDQPWPYLRIEKTPFFPWCSQHGISPIPFFTRRRP